MASQDGIIEELFWRSPERAEAMGGIHENTVLFYFAKSPFFDVTSNNASLESQAMYNPDIADSISSQKLFHAELDKLSGIEYRVHLGPQDFGPEAWPNQGRWVIRKQDRRINYDEDRVEVKVLATYFVVGISVYIAPSVTSVLTSRLLSTTSSLSKLMQKAASLPMYSPSTGYHYLPADLKHKDKATHTPGTSREGSVAPDQGSQSTIPSKTASTKGGDFATLVDAYQQFGSYSNDYMDENPLLGEPGAFFLSNSAEHVQARREAEAKRAQQQADLKDAQEAAKKKAATSRLQSEAPKVEPAALKPPTPSRKSSRGPDADASARKAKRRKSKAPGTPATTTS